MFVLNVINNRNYVKLKLFPSDFIEGTLSMDRRYQNTLFCIIMIQYLDFVFVWKLKCTFIGGTGHFQYFVSFYYG